MFMEHNSKEFFGITTKSQRTQAQAAGSAPSGYVLVEEDVMITFANEPRQS